MGFSLPPDLMLLVRRKVQVRLYPSLDAVIREALLLLDERDRLREARLVDLKRELAIGISQANRAQVEHLDEAAIIHLSGEASPVPCPMNNRSLLPRGVFVTTHAKKDLQNSCAHIGEGDRENGQDFLARILDGLPGGSRPAGEHECLDHLFPCLRGFIVPPYNIYYRAGPDHRNFVLIRVLHLAWDVAHIVDRIRMTDEG